MSDQPNKPLLSDDHLMGHVEPGEERPPRRGPMTLAQVRNFYEAARAKDRELIQALVDALEKTAMCCGCNSRGVDTMMELAAERGYKPTDNEQG